MDSLIIGEDHHIAMHCISLIYIKYICFEY